MLKEQYGDEWLEQKRADIMPNPARWLANGLINAYWRNKSGIEDIHAGVREVVLNFLAELDLTLALSGYSSLQSLNRSALVREA